VPDIGLQLQRHDGSVRIADPLPTLAGDLDCNNAVDAGDAIGALQSANGSLLPFCVDQGDVNCSGGVNAADGLSIVVYLAQIAQPLVAGCPPIGASLAPLSPSPSPAEEPPGDAAD
jgi:hypothetical protein